MNAWARARQPQRAIALWEEMKQDPNTPPDIVSYNSILKALALSEDPQALAQVEEWWEKLQQQPGIKPTIVTYTTMLWAYENHRGDPLRADALVASMPMTPNRRTLSKWRNVWVRAPMDTPGRTERLQTIEEKMEQQPRRTVQGRQHQRDEKSSPASE